MINKKGLFVTNGQGGIAHSFSWNGLASLLGMNYDADSKVLYVGDDKTTGFKNTSSSDRTQMTFTVKGSDHGLNLFTVYSYQALYLFYKKVKNGCFFDLVSSETASLKFGWCLGTDMMTGEKHYCYLINNNVTVFSDSGFNESLEKGVLNVKHSDIVTLSKFVSPKSSIVMDDIYLANCFAETTNCCEFLLNDKRYVSMNKVKDVCPFVGEVPEEEE